MDTQIFTVIISTLTVILTIIGTAFRFGNIFAKMNFEIQNLNKDIKELKAETKELKTETKFSFTELNKEIKNLTQSFYDLKAEVNKDIAESEIRSIDRANLNYYEKILKSLKQSSNTLVEENIKESISNK